MQKFLNTLWEFTGVKEDNDNFIQKAFKVCKVFKVKPLKNQSLMFHQRRQHSICFAKTFEGLRKSCRVLKKVKASEKKMKKDKELYEEDKQRHEEALQRYQEDHTGEMKISNLHKKCSKTKAVVKTAPKPPKRGYYLFLRE